MKTNDRFANHQVAFYKRAIKNYYGEEVKNREAFAVEVLCDAAKRESTKKLMKAQYNRVRPRDLAYLPEGELYKFVESFANKNDRRPAAEKFRELAHCCTHSQYSRHLYLPVNLAAKPLD